ncbi:hypothetical protein EMIT0P12_10204 [Pseudomonas sp. IT-P12]|uniref:hypothetical protein n=1 Tax=Pseudomonas sp. IT-P12 TaxID=3026450 RepID=UPI0039E07A56
MLPVHHAWLNGWLRKRPGNASDAAGLAQDTLVRVIKTRTAPNDGDPRNLMVSFTASFQAA